MEKVYLVECYKGSTVTDEETENYVSAICKSKKRAREHVERQIEYWKIEMKVPKGTALAASVEKNKIYEHTQISYNNIYISYFITEKEIEE